MEAPIPPEFTGTPEDFLDLIIYLQDKVTLKDREEASLEELGSFLAEKMNVSLLPYRSIAELIRDGSASGKFTRNWRMNDFPVDHSRLPSVFLSEELLIHVLDFFPEWGNGPEQFLKFIRITVMLSHLYTEDASNAAARPVCSEEALAEIFLEVFKMDISPYRDFGELSGSVFLEIDPLKILNEFHENAVQELALDELIQNVGLEPSQETVFEEMLQLHRTQSTIEKLRPYIHFY